MTGEAANRCLDALVDRALQGLDPALGGGEQLIEKPLTAAGVSRDGRCPFLSLGGGGACHHFLHPAAGLLADGADRLDAFLDLRP